MPCPRTAPWIAATCLLSVACSSEPGPVLGHTGGTAGVGSQTGGTAGTATGGATTGGTQNPLPAPPTLDASTDPVQCTDVVDLVFVLDVSSSMGFVLDELEADIDRVVTAANQLAPDAHFGLVSYVDNHALDRTGPLEDGRVHLQASTLQAAFADVRDTYTTPNRNPGDGPGGPETQNPICEENALDALHGAVNEFPWRDNATRVIILATDDTFLEAPDNYGDRDGDGLTDQTDYPREGDYPALRTLSETVTALQDNRTRVFSFTRPGFEKTELEALLGDCGCGTGCRMGDSTHVGDGWSAPYAGQTPIPEATDGADFPLSEVDEGSRSLADTINEVVVESYCDPPII